MTRRKTGTREWAATNVNIQVGCEHGCRYCYARYNAVNRFHQCTAEQWAEPVIDNAKVDAKYRSGVAGHYFRKGVIMFPSTHDITPRNISECMCVLQSLLEAGNKILVVSKPRFKCIREICETFKKYRKQLMFRFTIGSMNEEVLDFWEPNAPDFRERFQCLRFANDSGYQTSVSSEPYLDWDVSKIIELYEEVKPPVTDSIWIGKLRHFDQRVDLSGVTSVEKEAFVKPLKAAQSDETIWAIYEQLKNKRLVRWKDSIREVIEK